MGKQSCALIRKTLDARTGLQGHSKRGGEGREGGREGGRKEGREQGKDQWEGARTGEKCERTTKKNRETKEMRGGWSSAGKHSTFITYQPVHVALLRFAQMWNSSGTLPLDASYQTTAEKKGQSTIPSDNSR